VVNHRPVPSPQHVAELSRRTWVELARRVNGSLRKSFQTRKYGHEARESLEQGQRCTAIDCVQTPPRLRLISAMAG
jgi:hypothetical protein